MNPYQKKFAISWNNRIYGLLPLPSLRMTTMLISVLLPWANYQQHLLVRPINLLHFPKESLLPFTDLTLRYSTKIHGQSLKKCLQRWFVLVAVDWPFLMRILGKYVIVLLRTHSAAHMEEYSEIMVLLLSRKVTLDRVM